MKPLNGRIAAIAGASGTLGSAVARKLAADGAHVVLGCLSRIAAAQQLAAEIVATGGEALVLPGDVTVQDATDAWIETAASWQDRLDILVNAVGDVLTASALDIKTWQWNRMMSSNLYSAYYLARAAAVHMRRRQFGRIVMFAYSDAEHLNSRPHMVPYAIAKSGVVILARTLARELASVGITVNVLSPGLVQSAAQTLGQFDHLHDRIPAGRLGTPVEVADAVRFLVDEDASYINGTNLVISGGWQI